MRDFLALEREDVEELVHVAPVQSTPSGRGQAKGLSERSARMSEKLTFFILAKIGIMKDNL